MADDSGAFKTNPANSRQIPAFCDDPAWRCNEASPLKETPSGMVTVIQAADF
jgi:hypothetical protein